MSIKNRLQYWGVCIVMMLSVMSVNAQCYTLTEQDTTGSDSPIICNLDSLSCLEYTMYYDATFVGNVQFDGPSCAGTVENGTWLSFIAWDTLINFDLTYTSCAFTAEWPSPSVNLGVQVFLFNSDTLWNYTPLTYNCDCGDPYSPNTAINMVSDSLVIGNQYYLMIDGCAGNICDVQIEVTNLPATNTLELPELQEENVAFQNVACDAACLCPGTTIEISLLDHENIDNVNYDFVIKDEGGLTVLDINVDTSSFTFNALSAGTYTLEAEFENICDSSDNLFSTTFIIAPKDTITYPSDTLCAEDIQNFINWPLHWTQEGCDFLPMIGDSLYECIFIDSCFCTQVEQKRVVILPPTEQPAFDTILCGYNLSVDLPLTFMNYIFEEEQVDGIVVNTPMGTDMGCDSSVFLQVYAPFAEASIEIISCDGSEVTYLATLGNHSDYLDDNLITYDWIVDGVVESNGSLFSTSMDSLVSLVINWEYQTVQCSEFVVVDTTYLTNVESDFILPTVSCNSSLDTVFFEFEFVQTGTSTLEIVQLTSFTNYWDGSTWVFPGLTSVDEVMIQVSTGSMFCTGDEQMYTCSTNCNFYTINFPQEGYVICVDPTTAAIELDVVTNPVVLGTNAQTRWLDRNGIEITDQFMPEIGIDSTYKFYYEINELGCISIDSMEIPIFQRPYIEMLQQEVSFCEGTTVCLDTVFNYVGDGSWSFSGFPPNIEVINNDQDSFCFTVIFEDGVPPVSPQFLYLTGSSGQCDISNIPVIQLNIEPLDILNIQCFDQGFPIQLFWDDIDCHTSYDVYVNNEFIQNQTGVTYTPVQFPPGTDLNIEIVPISECLCPFDSAILLCNTGNCPIRPTELEWRDTTFCQSELPAFIFNTITMNNGGLTNTEQFSTPTKTGSSMFYIDIVYDQLCTYQDSFFINVVSSPTLELSATSPSCFEDSLGSVVATYNELLFEDECLIDGDLATMSEVDNMMFSIGTHMIEANSTDGCVVTETFIINPPIDFTISLSGSDNILEGNDGTYLLQTTISNWTQIDWFFDGNLVCENTTDCTLESMEYEVDSLSLIVFVYSEDNCYKSDTINILIEELIIPELLEDVFISNIFNPNAPGNDTWLVGGNVPYEVVQASVFDRWGNMVFDKRSFTVMDQMELWDGTINGTAAQQGVYIYVFEYIDGDGLSQVLLGDITLVR